jgi:ABC-type dipeptide/oligopeptide/nickel transport system permease component
MLSAILYRDYAVVSAGVFIIVILYVALNFTVDLLYFWADPTIRRDYA